MLPTSDVKGVGPILAKLLARNGIKTAENLADASLGDLEAIPGIGERRARLLMKAAAAYCAQVKDRSDQKMPSSQSAALKKQPVKKKDKKPKSDKQKTKNSKRTSKKSEDKKSNKKKAKAKRTKKLKKEKNPSAKTPKKSLKKSRSKGKKGTKKKNA